MKRIYILLISASLFTACADKQEKKLEQAPRPVKYAKIQASAGGESKTFAGIAKSAVEASLSFRANGLIESVSVKVGDRIKKGQLIATLDNRDALLSYEQAKAALENASVQKANAQSGLSRVRQLYQSNNVSLAEYEQAKNSFSSANANFESAKRSLDLQSRQLSYFKLYAPANGIVTAVNNEINEFIQAGAPLLHLNAGKDIELEIGVPEAYISEVKKGAKAEVKFSSLVGETFEAAVTEVGFALDASRNTYPVSVLIKKPSIAVRPGMAGDVTLFFNPDTKLPERLVIPAAALADGPDGNFVYVINKIEGEVGEIEKRPVKVGGLLAQGFELVEGLEGGDIVATAGLSSILPGMQVRLLQP